MTGRDHYRAAFLNLFAAVEFSVKDWVYNKGGVLSHEEHHCMDKLLSDLRTAQVAVESAGGKLVEAAFTDELNSLFRFFCVSMSLIAGGSNKAFSLSEIQLEPCVVNYNLVVETVSALSIMRGPLVLALPPDARRLFGVLHSKSTAPLPEQHLALIHFLCNTDWAVYVKELDSIETLLKTDEVGSLESSLEK